METPWGQLPVADAHVHFFSHRFFSLLAAEQGSTVEAIAPTLGWDMPAVDPAQLAAAWIQELASHGVAKIALIASHPADAESVIAATRLFPRRFVGYAMVNPCAPAAAEQCSRLLADGHIRVLCFFPAMHRYSMHDERAVALLDLAAAKPGVAAFVHCGALSVGVRKKLGLPSLFDLRYSNPLDLHALALRYPTLPFLVPHFGAGFFREALMLSDLCPNVYLDTSSSNSWMRYEPGNADLRHVFERTLAVTGPKRLLFGTDSSFFPRGWHAQIFGAQTRALYELGLKAAEAQLILHDNFERLFP
jgi:hypothetical protein